MLLENSFYTILSQTITLEGLRSIVRLNVDHEIFKAHFPNNPITPGVCLIQIAGELIARHLGSEIKLQSAKNIKFISVLDPRLDPQATFDISLDQTLAANIIVRANETVIAKISAQYHEI